MQGEAMAKRGEKTGPKPIKRTDLPPRPICGARCKGKRAQREGREGEPCKNPAGARTNHPGTGRCWVHGGRLGEKVLRHGLYADAVYGRIGSLLEGLRDDPRIFDLSEQLKLQIAVQKRALQVLSKERSLSLKNALMFENICEHVASTIERLRKVEEDRSYLVRIETVSFIIEQVILIMMDELRDGTSRKRVASRLRHVSFQRGAADGASSSAP